MNADLQHCDLRDKDITAYARTYVVLPQQGLFSSQVLTW